MKSAESIVENLTNVQAVSLLKQLNRNLYMAVPYKEVAKHFLEGLSDVQTLKGLDVETRKTQLDPEASIRATKQVLMFFAKDPVLASALVQAWDEIQTDDSLFIESIITIGLLANLTLFVATTEIEFKIGNVHFKKTRADANMLKETLGAITSIAKVTMANS